MTEAIQNEDDPSQPQLVETLPHSDWYLAQLIGLVNRGCQFPITVASGGLLISGLLISGKTYFERSSDIMKQSFTGEAGEVMATWTAEWTAIYDQDEKEEKIDTAEAVFKNPPGFIHLDNARIYVPGQKPIPTSGGGVLWRGRLSSIDGFNWGTLAWSSS